MTSMFFDARKSGHSSLGTVSVTTREIASHSTILYSDGAANLVASASRIVSRALWTARRYSAALSMSPAVRPNSIPRPSAPITAT